MDSEANQPKPNFLPRLAPHLFNNNSRQRASNRGPRFRISRSSAAIPDGQVPSTSDIRLTLEDNHSVDIARSFPSTSHTCAIRCSSAGTISLAQIDDPRAETAFIVLTTFETHTQDAGSLFWNLYRAYPSTAVSLLYDMLRLRIYDPELGLVAYDGKYADASMDHLVDTLLCVHRDHPEVVSTFLHELFHRTSGTSAASTLSKPQEPLPGPVPAPASPRPSMSLYEAICFDLKCMYTALLSWLGAY